MESKIVKGSAPVARKGRRPKYPFLGIRVCHYLVIKDGKENSIRACASEYGKTHGIKFSVAKQPDGSITVERTA